MIEKLFDALLTFVKALKYAYLKYRIRYQIRRAHHSGGDSSHQSLDIYSDPAFVPSVDSWGQKTTWREIQYLLANCKGKVLDMACGTGAAYPSLEQFSHCDYYGCDISKQLISKAMERGITPARLKVCDAAHTDYDDSFFDYSFSIGSLEHFTEQGISHFLKECDRITKNVSFHQIPTSRSGRDEGWIQLGQSYFNNSIDWWLSKFREVNKTVYILDSSWEDPISVGKWFVCVK